MFFHFILVCLNPHADMLINCRAHHSSSFVDSEWLYARDHLWYGVRPPSSRSRSLNTGCAPTFNMDAALQDAIKKGKTLKSA